MSKPKLTLKRVEKAIDKPFETWAHSCHEVSIAIVKSDLIDGPRRVARGWCEGVGSQHSWVVVGNDCYAKNAEIIDPTLWSYDSRVKGLWFGSAADGRHVPHGAGDIWEWGKPRHGGGEDIALTGLSEQAQMFVDTMLAPLDYVGWMVLAAQAPVGGWPAAEIIKALAVHPELSQVPPIDRIGMLTDINPGGLYLP